MTSKLKGIGHWHGTALKYIALIAWDGQKDIYSKYFIKNKTTSLITIMSSSNMI